MKFDNTWFDREITRTMRFSYNFSQLLGTVYRKGNIIFSQNGDSVLAPVGNKISVYDLKNNKSETLPIESRYNYTAIALSPNGVILIAINEDGEADVISLLNKIIIHKFRFNRPVLAVKFSPNGRFFALTKESDLLVYHSPGTKREYNPFVLERKFHGFFDETTCLDWSSDSRFLIVGSKDMSARVFSIERILHFKKFLLGGHTDAVVGCFFERDSMDAYTVAKNGSVSVWEFSHDIDSLKKVEELPRKKAPETEGAEQMEEEDHEEDDDPTDPKSKPKEHEKEEKENYFYKRLARHFVSETFKGEKGVSIYNINVTAAAYMPSTKLLVTGYSHGAFLLHEMPEFNLIHSLKISKQLISSVAINPTGDWIALGCADLGQLLVWEWQSETYIMKQQGHFDTMSSVAYSPDGSYVATGGRDSKVKVWDTNTGFSFVTFTEHTSTITGVAFTQTGRALLSSSLDGTVRAFDMARYRNFRTFTSPKPAQFSCLSIDVSGDLVAAGAQDTFDVYLWSLQTGKLLEVLSGHEGPVSSLCFSPSPSSSLLVSVSWDKTLRIWDAVSSAASLTRETVNLTSDGLAVCFRPDGKQVAVATLDGHISIFDPQQATQLLTIEGRNDLGSGKSDTDLVTAKKNLQGKAFNTLCYTADGECLLAAGQSKNICIYQVMEKILVKKYEITQNRSLDAMDDIINRRKMTEFGNMALIEEREDSRNGPVTLRLPGVRSGDMASRSFKPEVRVSQLQFSPNGRAFAATTTEGLLVYSLDTNLVFEPFDLSEDITPKTIRNALKSKDYSRSFVMALKLNESKLTREVYETIPPDSIAIVVQTLPSSYVERVLTFIVNQMDTTPHIEFHLKWMVAIFYEHGTVLQQRTPSTVSVLRSIQKTVGRKFEDLSKICQHNRYTLQYLLALGGTAQKRTVGSIMSIEDGDEEDSDEDEGVDEEMET